MNTLRKINRFKYYIPFAIACAVVALIVYNAITNGINNY